LKVIYSSYGSSRPSSVRSKKNISTIVDFSFRNYVNLDYPSKNRSNHKNNNILSIDLEQDEIPINLQSVIEACNYDKEYKRIIFDECYENEKELFHNDNFKILKVELDP
jgi:hypothetical protein